VNFSAPFTVVSNRLGLLGFGTPIVNGTAGRLAPEAEKVHAILQFTGTFTSIGFTDTSETWHGFHGSGVLDRAQGGSVPEPATLAIVLPASVWRPSSALAAPALGTVLNLPGARRAVRGRAAMAVPAVRPPLTPTRRSGPPLADQAVDASARQPLASAASLTV